MKCSKSQKWKIWFFFKISNLKNIFQTSKSQFFQNSKSENKISNFEIWFFYYFFFVDSTFLYIYFRSRYEKYFFLSKFRVQIILSTPSSPKSSFVISAGTKHHSGSTNFIKHHSGEQDLWNTIVGYKIYEIPFWEKPYPLYVYIRVYYSFKEYMTKSMIQNKKLYSLYVAFWPIRK